MLMRRCILCMIPGVFLLLLYDKEIVYGGPTDDGPRYHAGCTCTRRPNNQPGANGYFTAKATNQDECEEACNADTKCGNYMWYFGNYLACWLGQTSPPLVKQLTGLTEDTWYLSADWSHVGYKNCPATIPATTCTSFEKEYNRKRPNVHHILNFNFRQGVAMTAAHCQDLCKGWPKCRSASYVKANQQQEGWKWSPVKYWCFLYGITMEELEKTPQNSQIYTDNNVEANPVFVTYDRSCQCGPGQETNSRPDPISCKPCDKGFVKRNKGSHECSECVDGEVSNEHRTFCVCDSGRYLDEQTQRCKQCGIGTFKEGPGDADRCESCDTYKTTKQKGARFKSECEILSCPAGMYRTGHVCTPCQGNTYKPHTKPCCCTTPPTNSDALDDKKNFHCRAGYTLTDDRKGCKECADGSIKKETGNGTCSECTHHTTTMPGKPRTDCYCKKEYERKNGGGCEKCPSHTTKDFVGNGTCGTCKKSHQVAVNNECVCRKGYHFDRGGCTACAKGTYKDTDSDNDKCLSCDHQTKGKRKETEFKASTSMGDCTNTKCDPGKTLNEKTRECTECAHGHFKEDNDISPCEFAPTGYIVNDNKDGFECAAGYGYDDRWKVKCQPCAENWVKAAQGNLECQECEGCSQTIGPDRTLCVCSKGCGWPDDDKETCSECPRGTFRSMEGNGKCTECPDTFTTEITGADSEDKCTCGKGKYKDSKSLRCTKCPKNTFKEEFGTKGELCKSCRTFTVTKEEGATEKTQCVLTGCPKGMEPSNDSPAGERTCEYCNKREGSDTDDMKTCRLPELGEVVVESGTRFVCDAGYTRNLRTFTCQLCDLGWFKGSHGDGKCDECGGGQTNEDKDRTQCVCQAGHERIGTKCQACQVGTYKPGIGDKSRCLACKEAVKEGSEVCPEKEDKEEKPSPLPWIFAVIGGVVLLALVIGLVIGVVIHKRKKPTDSIITLVAAMSSNMTQGIGKLAASFSGLLACKKSSSSQGQTTTGSSETNTYSPESPTSSGSKLSPPSFDSPTTESGGGRRHRRSRRRANRRRSRGGRRRSRGGRHGSPRRARSRSALSRRGSYDSSWSYSEDEYDDDTTTGLCYDYDAAGIHQNDSQSPQADD